MFVVFLWCYLLTLEYRNIKRKNEAKRQTQEYHIRKLSQLYGQEYKEETETDETDSR